MEKISIELGSVQKTLLLPLWGRAVESRKRNPLLVDAVASGLIEGIDYDFSTIVRNISFITQLAWIARCIHIDEAIRRFLVLHPRATVVNIGCGLDTTFERVDNGTLHWFELDLPDVMALRTRLIGDSSRRESLTCSFLDETWMKQIPSRDGVIFIAAGVLYYFEEEQIRAFFKRLADAFPDSELVFDAASPRGVRVANQRVIRDGGMDPDALLKWGLKRAREIKEWDERIDIVAEYPLFQGLRGRMNLHERWGTFLSDRLRIMSMVHLRFRE